MELDRHLQECRVCAPVHERRLAMQSTIRDGDLRHVAPEALRKQLFAAITSMDNGKRPAQSRRSQSQWLVVAAAAASIMLIVAPRTRPTPNPLEADGSIAIFAPSWRIT
jgi:hypothetical protein